MLVTAALLAFVCGLASAAGSFTLLLFRLSGKEALRARLRRLAATGVGLSSVLERWSVRAGRGMRESIFSVSNLPYLILLGLCSACGLWFGIFYLRNPLAGIILAAGGVVFPEQVRRLRRRARREKVIEQLGAAVRVFSAEYSDTPHPVKALAATAAKLPDPVGGILRRTVSGLTAARNSEDVDVALINMGRELGGEYGKMFAQLVRLSFEDEAVKPLFSRLAARITAQQDLVRKNRLEISVDRALALILNLAVVPVYFIVVRTVPEASEFFHATAAGKGVIALCLFSAVVGSLLDIVIGGVDDG